MSPITMPSKPPVINDFKLTAEDIHGAASKAGLTNPAPGDHTASLEKNSNLAEALDSPEPGDHRHAR
jgi:hypothetical protein